MKFNNLPTYKEASEYWNICENSPSGLIWIKSPAYRIKAGQVAGSLHCSGYWEVQLKGITYKVHRLIYLLQTKEDPGNKTIDHINGKKDNLTLRIAEHFENTHYRGNHKTKKSSKYKGVYWSKQSQKWKSRIYINKKQIWLGYFNSEKEAATAYNNAAIKYLGEFAFINRLNE